MFKNAVITVADNSQTIGVDGMTELNLLSVPACLTILKSTASFEENTW